MKPKNKNDFIEKYCCLVLFLILILAFVLFTFRLSYESYWLDETSTVFEANRDVYSIFFNTSFADQMPFYFIAVHYWSSLFGVGEFAIRFLSVLFALGSIVILYFLAVNLFNKKVALLSSFLLATSPFFVEYAQEARMYTVVCFFSLLSLYFFYKSVVDNKKKYFLLFVLFTVLDIYTHFLSFYLLAFELLTYFLFIKKFNKQVFFRICSSLFVVFLLFLPKLFSVISAILMRHSQGASNSFSLFSFLKFPVFFGGRFVNLLSFPVWLCFIFILVFLFSSYKIFKKDKFKATFLFFGVSIPVFLLFIQSLFSWIVPRYIIFVLPILLLLISYAIFLIKNKYVVFAVIVFILSFNVFNLVNYYTIQEKEDWRSAVKFIDDNFEKDDLIIFEPFFVKTPFETYSSKQDQQKLSFLNTELNDTNIDELKNASADKKRIWLITSHSRSKDLIINELINEDYKSSNNSFKGIEVYLFEK